MDDSEIYCKLGEILYGDRFAFDRFRSAACNEVNEILNQIKKSDIVFLGDSVLNNRFKLLYLGILPHGAKVKYIIFRRVRFPSISIVYYFRDLLMNFHKH